MIRIRRNHVLQLALAAVLCILFPVAAQAADEVNPAVSPAPAEGGQPGIAPAAASPGGGMYVPDAPRIDDVICVSGCTRLRASSPGGAVEISGGALDSVQTVSFKAGEGRVRVRPDSLNTTRLTVTVPEAAVTGRIRVIGIGNSKSNLSETLTIGPALKAQGKVRVTDASSTPAKAFQFGKKKPTLNFIVAGNRSSANLRIDVVNSGGTVVRSFFREDVPTGSPQKLAWAGKVTGGKQAPNGSYRFVVRNADGTNATLSKRLKKKRTRARTSASKAADPFGFRMYRYIFPVKGPHTYGDSIGAGRGHQGVDVLARCGLPIRAARAGTVYYNDYQASGAGNYIVINTKGNGGKSHVYMHLPRRSKFKVGARVKTGQVIGHVGTTGRSTACHLHFEQWSAPGWYQGGTFMNPLAALKRWDRYS